MVRRTDIESDDCDWFGQMTLCLVLINKDGLQFAFACNLISLCLNSHWLADRVFEYFRYGN